jgi:hypothetical protein
MGWLCLMMLKSTVYPQFYCSLIDRLITIYLAADKDVF